MLPALLKNETALEHQMAEEVMMNYLRQMRHAGHYNKLLQSIYGFYQPLEHAIHQALTFRDLPDLPQRWHTPWLRCDLSNLGVNLNELPQPGHSHFLSKSEAWGAMYVMEGATLGGQYISRMLQKNTSLDLRPSQLHFFTSYGSDTGSKWKTFTLALSMQTDHDAIIGSARQTFLQFLNHLNETLDICEPKPAGS